MLSLPSPTLKLLSLSSTTTTTTTTTFLSPLSLPSLHHHHHHHPPTTTTIVASSTPPPLVPNLIIPKNPSPTPQPQNLYQPYRPPPSPLPDKYKNLDTVSIIDILSNRLGLWYDYAPLISTLFRDGFTPPSVEELTGISGVEQNRFVVAAQVRESIAQSPSIEPDVLSYFDSGGSEILYELRLLSASQRAAAATYIVKNRLDGGKARDIARAIKDFPSRQLVAGWSRFDYTKPGDCWAFTFFRQSREFVQSSDKRSSALSMAMEVAETEKAKEAIKEEIEGKSEAKEERQKDDGVRVPVVRLKYGEVAEATSVVVLPVCKAEDRENGFANAPRECMVKGGFGVVVSDRGWDRWVVLPKWVPVAGIGSRGVAVVFSDGRALPWRTSTAYMEEEMVVVVDREKVEVKQDDGFYLVVDDGGEVGLKVVRGVVLMEMGVKESLGMVVIVVRPPRDEDDDQLSDEDWE